MATAPRAVWKGYLKLGAVSCGVKLVGATSEAGKIHFRILNRKDQLPVKSAYASAFDWLRWRDGPLPQTGDLNKQCSRGLITQVEAVGNSR